MRGVNTTPYKARISSNAYRLVALKCRVVILSDELDGWYDREDPFSFARKGKFEGHPHDGPGSLGLPHRLMPWIVQIGMFAFTAVRFCSRGPLHQLSEHVDWPLRLD
jgi:hypothetical protein